MSEIQLHPRQRKWGQRAYKILETNYGYIDTSMPGSGKTYLTAWLAQEYQLNLLVVCPVIVISVWEKIITDYNLPAVMVLSYESLRSRLGPKHKPKGFNPDESILEKDKDEIYYEEELFIQPDDRIETNLNHQLLTRIDVFKSGRHSVDFLPTQAFKDLLEEGILLVFDECHFIKNKNTQYRACYALMNELFRSGSPSRFALLSGTPLDKYEQSINYLRLLHYIKAPRLYSVHPLTKYITLEGLQELLDKCFEYDAKKTESILLEHNAISLVKGKIKDFGIDINRICYELFIGIVKERIAGAMPPPELAGLNFDIKNGFYKITNDEDREQIAGSLAKLDEALAISAKGLKLKEQFGKFTKTNIGMINHLLSKIENAKAFDMARVALAYLTANTNCKVVLTLNYVETIKAVADYLEEMKPILLYGEVKQEKRAQLIDLFNKNPDYRVLIMNTQVGGMGISLHDTIGNSPRIMLISPSYRFLDLLQATKRIYREGSKTSAVIRFFYGNRDLLQEFRILEALNRKSNVLEGILEDEVRAQTILPTDFESIEEQ